MLILVAIIAGGVLIPLVALRVTGTRRHRDPLLLPVLILALAFTLGGLAEQFIEGGALDWKLAFGVLAFIVFARRWRAVESRPPSV